MVVVAQLVRVLVCGAEGRRFEPGQPPLIKKVLNHQDFFCEINYKFTYHLFYLPLISHLY